MHKSMVSIIIVTYNTDQLLFECLSSLASHDLAGQYDVVVINNGVALEADDDNWRAHALRGLILAEEGREEEAEVALVRATRTPPTRSACWGPQSPRPAESWSSCCSPSSSWGTEVILTSAS